MMAGMIFNFGKSSSSLRVPPAVILVTGWPGSVRLCLSLY